jgi:DNA helicase II / ATP-dependent DNA helicase PcrA
MDLFAGLNPQQRTAVEAVDGRVLILAGAGSGKTRVLTLRIAYLMNHLAVSPRAILGLTFTNKAAAEMRHRLAQMVENQKAKQVTLCTFHSFCMQILRHEIQHLGYTPQFTLCDEKDMQRLLNDIARDLLEYTGSQMPSLAPTAEAIAQARNKGLAAGEIEGTGSQWHDDFTRTVYQRLHDGMRAYNVVDFDSLLSLTVELFEKHPEILEKYQDRYRYVMIDEYQDTNPIQYRLASLLAAKYNNLCVVGDDDQSIYGWRGADVQNILDFSSANVIKLEQNYRSTNSILKAANAVIANNRKRHGKALWSNRGEGEPIEVFHAPTEMDEAQAVVCRMDRLREKHGYRWKDMAILYRSNALSRAFEVALLKHSWKQGSDWNRGIPYQIFGGTEFYERKEVKDLMAYLRIIVNPLDQEAMLRIINYPRRGIGEAALDTVTAYNRSCKEPLWKVLNGVGSADAAYDSLREKIASKSLKGISEFLSLIEAAKSRFLQGSLKEGILWLIEKIDYQKAIADEVKSDQMRAFKWENVQEFVSAISEYEKRPRVETEAQASLQDYLLTTPLEKQWGANSAGNGEDRVTLMTFHSAKGLEFPACFLVGMEDHIIPHEKSLKETGIEEERRLMYVAITRAMKVLVLSMARQRKRMGVETASSPSRFLMEMPKNLLKMTLWHEVD